MRGQVRVYVADIKGQLRVWDMGFLFRTKEQNMEIARQAQLRQSNEDEASAGTAANPKSQQVGVTGSKGNPAVTGSSKQPSTTFLTEVQGSTPGNGGTHPEMNTKKTQSSATHAVLLHERKAHSDAIVSCDIISYTAPAENAEGNSITKEALVTVALDKKVIISSAEDLSPLGIFRDRVCIPNQKSISLQGAN